ncbi:hypothetical protein CMI37_30310 [Candidatus Pacearchaeota archaeon]|nr:hypothetical protein [Candidatus Pacearchaeota archaeon]|tara:strand:- start:226 stop:507 length:282 start_codon:yes stop_codon:yes gene_type:complete
MTFIAVAHPELYGSIDFGLPILTSTESALSTVDIRKMMLSGRLATDPDAFSFPYDEGANHIPTGRVWSVDRDCPTHAEQFQEGRHPHARRRIR